MLTRVPFPERERTVDGLAARTVTVVKSWAQGRSGGIPRRNRFAGGLAAPNYPKG